MDNLAFSLNATLPIFLTMLLGILFRRTGLFDEKTTAKMNTFVFKAALPVALFQDLAAQDLYTVWDTRFVIFCAVATLLSIGAAYLVSCCLKEKSIQAEFIQAAYRSSASILGFAFLENIYGNSGMVPLMIIASVPIYNVMAVTVLTVLKPERGKLDAALMKKTVISILTNPILIGIMAGLLWALLRIPMHPIIQKTVKNLASLSTPLGLMTMGAAFDLKKASGRLKPVFLASFLKLFGFAAIFLPFAVALGFRGSHLVSILVMLGSADTVASYSMSRNMGHEGSFTSACIVFTTLGASFSLTFWLFLLKSFSLV